jgi:hypothetical protein
MAMQKIAIGLSVAAIKLAKNNGKKRGGRGLRI